MIYVITAQSGSPSSDDRAIGDWIRGNFDSWTEPVAGTWIVEGALAAEQIENALAPLLASGDRLLIIKAGTEAVWRGVSAEAARWLAANFPGSITNRIPGEGAKLAGHS
jgi:hypothetical protein